jgi:hypothetical protein
VCRYLIVSIVLIVREREGCCKYLPLPFKVFNYHGPGDPEALVARRRQQRTTWKSRDTRRLKETRRGKPSRTSRRDCCWTGNSSNRA